MGNPGARFAGTRHNVGFAVAEAVAASAHLTFRKKFLKPYEWTGISRDQPLVLVRPLTYMNRSGAILPGLLRKTQTAPEDLVVVCDNLDLPAGTVRLKRRGSARSHNGLSSIMDFLQTGDFTRIYIGIGRPEPGSTVAEHVLGLPPSAEEPLYRDAVAAAADAVMSLQDDGTETVMNTLNRRS